MKKFLILFVASLALPAAAQTITPDQIRPSTTNGQVVTTVGGVSQWAPPAGGGGSFPGSPTAIAEDLYVNPIWLLESGGSLLASNGCKFYGDSNSGGAGLGTQYAWTTLAYNALNCVVPDSNISINVAGDTSKDFANRSFMNESPIDQGNPIYAGQYSTNNLKYEGNTVPSAAHQLTYKTNLAAGISNMAMSINDKYMPTTQPSTSTSYTVSANNVVTMQAANGYYIGQRLLMSGCTSYLGQSFNALRAGITVTAATPTSYSFAYSTNYVAQSSTADSCVATPSAYWNLSGTWNSVSAFDYFNIVALGVSQGIQYQVGNQLTLACPGGNMVATVNQIVTTTTPPGSFTIDITSVSGGGVITGVALNSPGDGSQTYFEGQYFTVVGGDNTAIVQVHTISGTYTPSSVTLYFGGSSGYSTASGASVSALGQLYSGGFKISTPGSGCTNVTGVPATCSVGTGTACGVGGVFVNTVGPQLLTTSTGGSMTISNLYVGFGHDQYPGGDVKVWYPVGPNYGGSWTITADGGSPLVDSWTGNSVISEVDGSPDIIENFPTGDTIQEAHFTVTPNVQHSFTITCVSGTKCGILGMGLPPSTHNPGVNGPNFAIGGAIPIGGNSDATQNCGQTSPGNCATYFSQMVGTVVNEEAKVEGLNVKYFDNLNVSSFFDYLNNGSGFSSLMQNRISNSTNSLHGDSSFHVKISNNLLNVLKAVQAPPSVANYPGGYINYTNANAGQYTGMFTTLNSTPITTPQYSTTNQSLNVFTTSTQAFNVCNYAAISGQNPGFTPSLYTCPWIFGNTNFTSLPASVAANNASVSSGTHTFTASAFDSGIYTVSQTGGTGCTGTGAITPTGGTFTVAAVYTASCSGGAINAILVNPGIYTAAPTGFTNTFSGSTGYNITFGLATEVAIASQVPGTYTGSGTLTPTGGTCANPPTLNSSLVNGGIVASINTPGNCTVVPTGVSISGYSGSGFSIVFYSPKVNQPETWSMRAGFQGTSPYFRILAPSVTYTSGAPYWWLETSAQGGFKFLTDAPGANNLTLSLAAMSSNAQWNIGSSSGTPVVALTTTGTTGPATLATTGVLNIPNYAGGGAVSSVFGRTGAVVAASGDYTVGQVTGAVSAIGVTTANGVSGTSSGGSTPNLTISLGAITPTSVAATGAVSGASLSATGATPGSMQLTAGTGSIPALTANSAGFAAPVTGGTAFLYKLPATASAGLLHAAAPATADGVNESALTSSAVAIADLSATGTPSSTTFLRGDNTWAAPSGSGTVNSGTINQVAYYAATGTAVSGETNLTTAQLGTGTPAAGKYVDGAAGAWTGLPFQSLTTTGTSGAATLVSGVLNVPNYAAGVGTVTTFSSGNLAPLFTTSVATATSTPAQTFTASTFGAHLFYGNNTGSTATPAAALIGTSDFTPNAYIATTGAVNVMVATLSPAATALVAGLEINVLPNLANTTTTPTINVNGLGAKNITKLGTTALAVGDMTTTAVASLIYDGTQWQLKNPQTSAGGGTTTNALTMNNSGSGAASGTTFNGALAQTISYNTIGAAPATPVATVTVSYSSTPAFAAPTNERGTARISLTGDVTAFTVASGSDGQILCIDWGQDTIGGRSVPFSAAPANLGGFFSIGSTASKENMQCYNYIASISRWIAMDGGRVNQ